MSPLAVFVIVAQVLFLFAFAQNIPNQCVIAWSGPISGKGYTYFNIGLINHCQVPVYAQIVEADCTTQIPKNVIWQTIPPALYGSYDNIYPFPSPSTSCYYLGATSSDTTPDNYLPCALSSLNPINILSEAQGTANIDIYANKCPDCLVIQTFQYDESNATNYVANWISLPGFPPASNPGSNSNIMVESEVSGWVNRWEKYTTVAFPCTSS